MTTATINDLTITINGWPEISGVRVGLAYDPEAHEIYTWSHVGPGSPAPVYHGEHVSLAAIKPNVVPESLEEWLREHEDEVLAAIADSYPWGDRCGFSERLSAAIRDGAIATDWPAGDWLAVTLAIELIDEIGEVGLDRWLDTSLTEAADNGQHLDREDLEETVRSMIEDALVEYDAEIEEWGEDAEPDLTDEQVATARRILA